jgi:acyl carrier protein
MNCFEEFKKIIASKVKDASAITMESNLKDLGLDSLDLLEIVSEGEELLNVEFQDEELLSFKTIGDVVSCAEGKLK